MDIIIARYTEFGFVSPGKDLIYDKNSVFGAERGALNLLKLAEKSLMPK